MTQLFNKFSSKENLKKAYEYVKKDLESSNLQIFPINNAGITAIEELGDDFFLSLQNYLRSANYSPDKPFYVYFPKDNLGLRPVCAISTVDRIVYQAIFNEEILGKNIDDQLTDRCLGNRISKKDGEFLANYIGLWNKFHDQQKKAFADGLVWRIEIDIKGFFENISINKLKDILLDEFECENNLIELLEIMLSSWVEGNDGMGVPQGPEASWIISNAYLNSLDKHILQSQTSSKVRYFRYADDMVIMGKTEEDVLNTVEEIAIYLRNFCLSLNEKTQIYKIIDVEELEKFRFSASEIQLGNEPNLEETIITPDRASEIVDLIVNDNDSVLKRDLQELKRFLSLYQGGANYYFSENCLLALRKRPSIFSHLIRFLGSEISRNKEIDPDTSFLPRQTDPDTVLNELCKILKNNKAYKWLKIWVQRLLTDAVEKYDICYTDFKKYTEETIKSSENIQEIILGLLFQYKNNLKTNSQLFLQKITKLNTDYEKALVGFFSFNVSENKKVATNDIAKQLCKSNSLEANLIGYFLHPTKPDNLFQDKDKFSFYLKNKNSRKTKRNNEIKVASFDGYTIHKKVYKELGAKQRYESKVRFSLQNLITPLGEIYLTKTEKTLLNSLIVKGGLEEDNLTITYKPVESKRIIKNFVSRVAFDRCLLRLRKKGKKKDTTYFVIEPTKDKKKNCYQIMFYR